MKRAKLLAAVSVSSLLVSGVATAGPPPLDRPTPPPCCADGICYAHSTTFGYYGTRWRRWPGDVPKPPIVEPTPAERLGPDLPPYETPSAEEEDRRAPPPTAPPPEETETEVPEGTAPLGPAEGGLEAPEGGLIPEGGLMPWEQPPPPGQAPQSQEGGGRFQVPRESPLRPWESEAPTNRMDPDAPPAPPFGGALLPSDSSRQLSAQTPRLPANPSTTGRSPLSAADQPPALPLAFRRIAH